MEQVPRRVGICKDPCNRRYGRVSVRKLLGLPAAGEVGAGCDADRPRWRPIRDGNLRPSEPSLLLFVVPCPVLILVSSRRAVPVRINNCEALRKAVGTWEVVDKVSLTAIIITNVTHLCFLPGAWHTAYQKPAAEGRVAATERDRETFSDLRTYFHLISEHRRSGPWSHVFLFRHPKLRI